MYINAVYSELSLSPQTQTKQSLSPLPKAENTFFFKADTLLDTCRSLLTDEKLLLASRWVPQVTNTGRWRTNFLKPFFKLNFKMGSD